MKTFKRNRLFLYHYLFAIIMAFILAYTQQNIGYEYSGVYHERNILYYLYALLIAPILETIIIQLIPFKVLSFLKVKNYYINFILLTALFAVGHNKFTDNALLFALFAISCSIPVNYFLQTQKTKGVKIAVIRTSILHSAYNATMCLLALII